MSANLTIAIWSAEAGSRFQRGGLSPRIVTSIYALRGNLIPRGKRQLAASLHIIFQKSSTKLHSFCCMAVRYVRRGVMRFA